MNNNYNKRGKKYQQKNRAKAKNKANNICRILTKHKCTKNLSGPTSGRLQTIGRGSCYKVRSASKFMEQATVVSVLIICAVSKKKKSCFCFKYYYFFRVAKSPKSPNTKSLKFHPFFHSVVLRQTWFIVLF